MSEETLTLKEMCALFDVTPRTLRYYEYLELIAPAKVGRTRHYGSTEKARVKLIRQGRRFGFPLEEIRQWLELYSPCNQNRGQMERWIQMSTDQLAQLEERRVELEEISSELARLRQMTQNSLDALD
ncbi:MAG: MerR family DNA-binding protein [Rhodobacteraceae bacterium]|nr:MerR family DNA-binding protein [Paracoccaceae bacterium]